MTVRQLLIKRLGALPVIRTYLERVQLKERVEALAPVRDVAQLTKGEVVEALVANRLTAPRPLDDSVDWAEGWALEETFGIRPDALNDDRLGRCLDDIAAVHAARRGEVTVQAMTAFGLETQALRWDLTAVLVTGAYPVEEQAAEYAQVRYGYSSGEQEQIRYLQVPTDDGAVPIWDAPYDGNVTDVVTVIETRQALREHAGCQGFVLIGDSKLLSESNRRALLSAGVGYLAPLARTPELDAAFLAIPPQELTLLAYGSERERRLAPEDRTTYRGAARLIEVAVPDGSGTEQVSHLRRLVVVSSAERAACRRTRARQRERAAAEILGVLGGVGSRWSPTAERAAAKIEALLQRRHLTGRYRVWSEEQDELPRVTCTLIPAARARAAALDGYSVLETTRTAAEADAAALLVEWTGQWQIEQRHRNAKGPLRIRPLFVTSNRRIVGLVTILGLALMVFSLIERAARRALAPGQQVPHRLAGQVAARPTGDNLFKALRDIALVTFEIAGLHHQRVADLPPLQRTVLPLLSGPEAAYARLSS